MYFVTYCKGDTSAAGILTGTCHDRIVPLTALSPYLDKALPDTLYDLIRMADDSLIRSLPGALEQAEDRALALSSVTLCAPLPHPASNIVCLGKNYVEHVHEIRNIPTLGDVPEYPIYFTKRPTAVTGPDTAIPSHAAITQALDYEAELAVIIGREGCDIPREAAEDHIFGYTIANDLTARDLQRRHSQWFKGKSLDGFCPMGPALLHKSALPMPFTLSVSCRINGETRQHSDTSHMIFDIPAIIEDLSQGITLKPGDIILTGTPAGVGAGMNPPSFLKAGDCIETEIEKLGILKNTII